MGTTTPNIGLYIPADGETNYGTAFANGMLNLDTHDHSGAPNKGVPLSSAGLAAGSVTRDKLNANVFGAGVHPDINNAIEVDGVLLPIFNLGTNGLIVRTSASTAAARTITGTAGVIDVVNGNGVSGNPTLNLNSAMYTPTVTGTVAQPTSSGGAIAGYTPVANTYEYMRIGNWVMIDYDLTFTGSGGAAGDLNLVLPIATAASTYWVSGFFGDGSTTKPAIIGMIGTQANIYDPSGTGLVQVPGTPFSYNIQFTGIYRVA